MRNGLEIAETNLPLRNSLFKEKRGQYERYMTAIFAHLHSSPLVVRRRQGSEWRSLSASGSAASSAADTVSRSYGSGLEAVEIIDVKEERKLLVQCLRESKKRIVWHSEVADLHTFRKVLSFGCRALHFSGHGVPGKVIFEDKKCEAQFISQQELRDLLLAGGMEKFQPPLLRNSSGDTSSGPPAERVASDSDDESDGVSAHEVEKGWISLEQLPRPQVPVKLVFVSACHSESVAEAFVGVGVPHVVVVSKEDKVLDKKAMEFSKAFYTALFAGHSVAKAFEIGQVQADISITSDAGNSKFKLLGNGDHSEKLFRDVPEGKFIENSLPPPVNESDAVAEFFVGRSIEVHHVYKSLVEGARLISITGERGIGKTEIALQCAQYATERHLFRHIFFLRLENEGSASAVGDEPGLDDSAVLVRKFAKSLWVKAEDVDELASQVRLKCTEGNYLLILDGCNRKTRQDPKFRSVVSLLLRRVSSLSLLLTGDGKLGAMDGVGEKIVTVERLPPADAALLFTLRAPRKIKVHEMGGSPDLAAFGEHPVVRSLMGHPRTICAVSQFLENKDMELDQHEFLNYIIPSVNAGLSVGRYDQTTSSFPSFIQETIHASHAAEASLHNHHNHHHHHNHQQSWDGASGGANEATRRMKPPASLGDVLTKTSLVHSQSERGASNFHRDASAVRPHLLLASHSESDLVGTMSTTSQRQMCILKIADHVKWAIPNEEGRLVWAHAAVANAGVSDDEGYTAAAVHQLMALHEMALDMIAPHVSRYFATELKHNAVTRPLSLRSIDFLSKSTLVWGGVSPAQQDGYVSLEMFAVFWRWFAPLTECILYSHLWSYTQPRLLHGFLSKGACVNMLQRAPPGTFLLRFSETRLRCFVISYVHDDGCVQFVPVTRQLQEGGWHVALQEDNSGVTFPTIQDLVLSVTVLKYLFPQTPKEVAFQIHV